jgi:signal transduction histidine kinase
MDTDLEIISNLSRSLNFAVIRASNAGFLYMNEQALELFGFTSLAEAKSYGRMMLFADRDSYQHLTAKQKSYGVLTNERVLFMRKDHTNFWGALTSKSYESNGDLYHDEIIVDISDQVKNEHTLREKGLLLEKVAGELDRFVYSASHDLRSPISSMKGLISLFETNSEALTQEQFLYMMTECLNKLETFISKLVLFSKNSNEPVVIEPVDLRMILMSILDELREHDNSSKVEIECILPEDCQVYSDVNKVHTTLSHIIRNAFDYHDASKCSGLLLIKAEIQREKVLIEVLDNGIGIDKKYIPTIFQMFYRASRLSRGSGLGLYVAREAIVRLGGSIDISSELNLGTLVKVQFPNAATRNFDEERQTA